MGKSKCYFINPKLNCRCWMRILVEDSKTKQILTPRPRETSACSIQMFVMSGSQNRYHLLRRATTAPNRQNIYNLVTVYLFIDKQRLFLQYQYTLLKILIGTTDTSKGE